MKRFYVYFFIMSVLILAVACTGTPAKSPNSDQMQNFSQKQTKDATPQDISILTTKKLRNVPALSETDSIQPTGQLREFQLEAKIAKWQLVSGVQTDAYTFNETVPGPVIRAKEGDTPRYP